MKSNANLGKNFERELNAVHDWYRMKHLADIIQNHNEWQFTTEKQYQQIAARVRAGKFPKGFIAECDNGRKLIRIKSDIDFSGGGDGFSVAFDAKETSGSNLPLANLKPHQIKRLADSRKCGTIAGFMVKFTSLDRVFFVPIKFVEEKESVLLKQGKRAKPGTASISISEMEKEAWEIRKHPVNGLWDWLDIVLTCCAA